MEKKKATPFHGIFRKNDLCNLCLFVTQKEETKEHCSVSVVRLVTITVGFKQRIKEATAVTGWIAVPYRYQVEHSQHLSSSSVVGQRGRGLHTSPRQAFCSFFFHNGWKANILRFVFPKQ